MSAEAPDAADCFRFPAGRTLGGLMEVIWSFKEVTWGLWGVTWGPRKVT